MNDIDEQPFLSLLGKLWWLQLIRGIVLLVLGLYAVFQPGMTLATFAAVAGVFLVIDGVLAIGAGIAGKQIPSRGWTIVRGIVAVIAGVFVFANPVFVAGLTASFVIAVIGILAILSGILEITAAVQDRKQIEGEGWLVVGGVILILIGVALLAAPLAFGLTLVRVLGVLAILSSIAIIVFAFRIRSLPGK